MRDELRNQSETGRSLGYEVVQEKLPLSALELSSLAFW